MMPELFKIGPFTVYSFGFMLATSLIVAGYILMLEFRRAGINDDYASEITMIAMIFGISGSKLFYLFEEWKSFLNDPWGMIFNAGGLTFYGGFLLTVLVMFFYLRKRKLRFFQVGDLISPSLALAYGIGRIGCHLAGDGDYGIPTSLPWGVSYEKGVVPPSYMFKGSAIAANYPNGIVPNDTPLHPTPVYEFFGALFIFLFLWSYRKRNKVEGRLFMLYLILTAVARFLVEYLRLNPVFLFGFTEAQFISVVLFATGIYGFYRLGIVTKK